MAAEAGASMEAAVVASIATAEAAADFLTPAEEHIVVAAAGAARGRLAAEAGTRAADLKSAAIQSRHELSHRIFALPSTMDSGIRLATPPIPSEVSRQVPDEVQRA